MKELKRCPFCGGKAHIMKMGYPHWIYCTSCGAQVHGGVIGEIEGEKASIEAWNRRTQELQPKKSWFPIKARPMTDEEEKKDHARFGCDIDGDEAILLEGKLPDNGQKIWVCSDHGYVWQDTCEYDGGLYYLKENGDWFDIVAWMPFDEPEQYKAESEGEE